MADIYLDKLTNDIKILGGDLVFTSDYNFAETMRQKIKATLRTFLSEWFLDDQNNPIVGVPYFQSLLENKLPTLELADTIFRNALLNIDGVTAVEELTFEYDQSTRVMSVNFKVRITNDGDFIEDVIEFPDLIS